MRDKKTNQKIRFFHWSICDAVLVVATEEAVLCPPPGRSLLEFHLFQFTT